MHADVCLYNGNTYQVGDTFPAGDGCNTWYGPEMIDIHGDLVLVNSFKEI